jgi:hypothetical protein
MRRGFLGMGALALVLLASARGTRSRQSCCPREESGIILPAGFCATLFADLVGMARHVVVGRSGAVFVAVGTVTGTSVSHLPPEPRGNGARSLPGARIPVRDLAFQRDPAASSPQT